MGYLRPRITRPRSGSRNAAPQEHPLCHFCFCEMGESGGLGDAAKEIAGKGSLGIFSGVVRATKPGGEARAARGDQALPVVAAGDDQPGRCC